jgi:hypothetical protein
VQIAIAIFAQFIEVFIVRSSVNIVCGSAVSVMTPKPALLFYRTRIAPSELIGLSIFAENKHAVATNA